MARSTLVTCNNVDGQCVRWLSYNLMLVYCAGSASKAVHAEFSLGGEADALDDAVARQQRRPGQ